MAGRRNLGMSLLLLAVFACIVSAQTAKHRFLVIEFTEVNDLPTAVKYINQYDTTTNWSTLPDPFIMDMQLIGNNRVLVSTTNGYREYDIATGQEKKRVSNLPGEIHSVERLSNGFTMVAGNPAVMRLLNAKDSVVKVLTLSSSTLTRIRHMRSTSRGTFLLASEQAVFEIDTTGKGSIIRKVNLSGYLFKAVSLKNGNIMASSGPCEGAGDYFLKEIDTTGSVKKTIAPAALGETCFTGFQMMKNGSIAIADYFTSDYGCNAAAKCAIEVDPTGKVVWSYVQKCGSFVEIIVLDSLNTALLHNEANGIMAPVTGVTGLVGPDRTLGATHARASAPTSAIVVPFAVRGACRNLLLRDRDMRVYTILGRETPGGYRHKGMHVGASATNQSGLH